MKATIVLCLFASAALADDVLFLSNGATRAGRIVGIEGANIRLQVPLSAPVGAPLTSPLVFASVAVPRADVSRIEFSPNPAQEHLLRSATPLQLPAVRAAWTAAQPWLEMPRSPSARVGVLLGDLLLRSADAALYPEALRLFQIIEDKAWSEDDQASARHGRLRAMVASGQAREAIAEATELAQTTENPEVLIAAKLLLAEADATALRKLIEDNPRWQEDVAIRPERERLYQHALDLYLFPYLFHGSEIEASSRGLWGATKLYEYVGEPYAALETARDIVAIYPSTKYAALAAEWVSKLPEEVRAYDAEKEARKDAASSPETDLSNQAKTDAPGKKSPKKSHEKKPDPQN